MEQLDRQVPFYSLHIPEGFRSYVMKKLISVYYVFIFIISVLPAISANASINLALSQSPLFLTSVQPNVMVMLDNSGSMKNKLRGGGYDDSFVYFGFFDSAENYIYDSTIPINSAAYLPVVVSGNTGAFVENACTPAIANTTCWSGNYLNWMTTKRIDGSRRVLIGGKLESRTTFNYGTDLNYKIVSNNEMDDKLFNVSSSNSDSFSPIPNNAVAAVSSPAEDNSGAVLASYNPYAQITAGVGGGKIYSSAGIAIGEFGSVEVLAKVNASKLLKNNSWVDVSFELTYATVPVVVAKPPTYNGADPGIIRIRNVTTTGFQINFQEWKYDDGNHTNENVYYMVLKGGGYYELPGGIHITAGTLSTNKEYVNGCGSSRTNYINNHPMGSTFPTTPIVIASVTTYNDSNPVNAKVWGIDTNSFDLALQEEEDEGGHASETISWIAIEPGTVNDTTHSPNWKLEAANLSSVDETPQSFNFSSTFSDVPLVLAAMQSLNGSDTAALRWIDITKTSAEIFVEEETSCDSDLDHVNESVGYIALSSVSSGIYNVALAVKDEPTGLLQDIQDKVRIGVSYYRFLPDANNIYSGEKSDGGTMKFNIPINPFVKKPTNTSLPAAEQGYRELSGYIGSSMDDIVDSLEHYPLVWGTTPLAENLWEVIQYFEQDDPHYPDITTGFKNFDKADGGNPQRDPFYYPDYLRKIECARASVIIFTDGAPYRDANVPASVVDFDSDSKANDYSSTDPNEQGKDNLDDVACWAFSSNGSSCDTDVEGSRDLRPSDIDGDQFLKVYTVAFGNTTTPEQILQDTAENAGGSSYGAENGLQLKSALEEAFTAAIEDSSASSVSVNTGSITGSSTVFQARFNSNSWSGELLAYPINSDGSLQSAQNGSVIPAAASRIIVTHNGTKAVPFQWSATPSADTMTSTQHTLLEDVNTLNYIRGDQSNEELSGGTLRDRTSVLGDMVHSSPAIVNGNAEFQYPDDGWAAGAGSGAADDENTYQYSTYKTTIDALNSNAGRRPAIYVGSNDGMLHAFDATTGQTNSGKELFAYIPITTFANLKNLSDPNYSHQYMVDGSPTVGDVLYDYSWHTVLVSGFAAGGQGYFAIDVTDPADFNSEVNAAAKILWEIDDSFDSDLGYTFSQPNIVRMADGNWAAVFGNGYNNTHNDGNSSSTGNAVLYIVNIKTGALIKKIDTGVGISASAIAGDYNEKPNGLSTVSPVDVDRDNVVDYIYAGDLYGNMWKFDVDNNNSSNWEVAIGGEPLFTACYGTCKGTAEQLASPRVEPAIINRQPITSRPQVGRHPTQRGYMIYFGTGQYFEVGDNSAVNQLTQTFYAIWDKEADWSAFSRAHLLKQDILKEVSEGFDTDNDNVDDVSYDLRITSKRNTIWYSGDSTPVDADSDSLIDEHLGWYMDLYNSESNNTNNYGERQVSNSILRNDRIIFTTLIPLLDPCENGGSGWLMELDSATGSRLDESPFNLNDDDAFDKEDFITVTIDDDDDGLVDDVITIPVSGKKSKEGIPATPGVISGVDGTKEYKYSSGSSGNIEVTEENPGSSYTGRQSWKQCSGC